MDVMTAAQRSRCMARIRAENTKPELVVRRIAHALGFRFRLHRRDLPGKPDLVFPARRAVIFVHGCFWHQHHKCSLASRPKSRRNYWGPKLRGNVRRDIRSRASLKRLGWASLVIWECETKNVNTVERRLIAFFDRTAKHMDVNSAGEPA
jgi:DNA mismatch endonuclease (patch repair protein)